MKYVYGTWIILAVVWWLFALYEADKDRFSVDVLDAIWLLLFLLAIIPFALCAVIVGAIQGVVAIITERTTQ